MYTDEILCKELTRLADGVERIAKALEQSQFRFDLPKPTDRNKLVSEKEAAELLGISTSWFRQKRTKGDGPPYVKMGSLVRYRISELEEWCRVNSFAHTSEWSARKRY